MATLGRSDTLAPRVEDGGVGHALTGVSNNAKAAGCDGFITKPCLPEDLVGEIKKALARVDAGDKHRRSGHHAKVKA